MSSEVLDRSLVLDAVRVTEIAAIAAWKMVGRGDEKAADQAAVDAMRTALNELSIDSFLQKPVEDAGVAPIVLTTHAAPEEAILDAVRRMQDLAVMVERPRMIRIARI